MGFIAWIILGALAGWVAGKLAGTDDQMGCLANIFVGVVGAFIFPSFIVAVVGSTVLLALLRVVRRA